MKRMNGEGSIYYDKKHGRYVVSVTAGRSPETGKPIRKQRTTRSGTKALELLSELREKYVCRGAGRAGVHFASYLRLYAEAFKKPMVRENTWLNYESLLKSADKLFGALTFADLSPTGLQQLLISLPSQNTAHRLAILAKAACQQALQEGIIKKSPLEGVNIPAPKRQKEIPVLSLEEVSRLLQAAEGNPPLHMAILLQYMTGMRAEEVLGLSWQRIDLEERILQVEQVTNVVHGKVSLAKPKTSSSRRRIPFPAKLQEALIKYHDWQDSLKCQQPHLWQEQGSKLLYTYDGTPLGIHQYASAFRRAARKAEVQASPHVLRHTHATQLFLQGWHPKDVQARLGHSSISITLDTYTHYSLDRSRKLADGLDMLYPKV